MNTTTKSFFNHMKKTIWGFATLSLLLLLASSCTNELIESKKDRDHQISFNAAVGKQTKATEFNFWGTGEGFTAYAYYDGTPTLFETFVLVYDGTDWSYNGGTPVYHPSGATLNYYAIYPADHISSWNVTPVGVASFNYTVQAATTQEDLIAATFGPTTSPDVTLPFQHLLAQVNFAIQGIEDFEISVSGIWVSDVFDHSTYTFGSGWGSLSGNASYPYDPAVTATTDGLSNDILYLGNTGDAASTKNNGNGNALMLMPQSFSTTGSTFSFNYSITDMTTSIMSGSATADFSDMTTTTWEPGKRYLYLLDFSDLLEKNVIKFTVTVTDWIDYDDPLGGIVEVVVE